uniref:Uncharacterized protein n=1 Tax=Romanomermis culicivorax TaxID=13658 RepID=A0A915KTW0_ROMCU
MPSISSLKRTAQHVRQRQNRPIALPANLIDLQIPNQYSTTLASAPFLLYDSGPEPYHMLIFSTAANMQLLSESQHWYGDGTFKTAPLLFEQLYTIHRIQLEKTFTSDGGTEVVGAENFPPSVRSKRQAYKKYEVVGYFKNHDVNDYGGSKDHAKTGSYLKNIKLLTSLLISFAKWFKNQNASLTENSTAGPQ